LVGGVGSGVQTGGALLATPTACNAQEQPSGSPPKIEDEFEFEDERSELVRQVLKGILFTIFGRV
jgi:hypothetical protein